MHAKTKRRLSILLAAFVLGTGGLGGLVVYRKQHTAYLYAQSRQEGLAAYQAKDYLKALNELGHYLGRYQTDSDALYACAESRLHIQEPDRHEIPVALGLLNRFVDLNPTRDDVRRQMLDLYLQVGFFTETIKTADYLLAKSPKDPEPLRAKARAQFGLRHYDASLKTALQYNEAAPKDLEGQVLTLADMQRNGATDLDIVGRADKLLAQHPDDPHFQLLKSIALDLTGDRRSAIPWAQKAAAHPANDPAFYKALGNQLDSLGLFADADRIQELAAKLNPDPQTRYRWISRLVEAGKYDQVLSLVSVDDPKSPATSVDEIVCRIIAMSHLHRDSEAEALQAILAQRGKTNPEAAAAASAIDLALLHPGDPQAAITACNAALSSDMRNPFFLSLRAQAYERTGELELATDDLKEAAGIAPSWAEPLVRASSILLKRGRAGEAFIAAQSARARAPHDRDALVAVASSGIALIPPGRTDELKDLLTLIEQIESQYPNEQRVLPIHVMVDFRLNDRNTAEKLLEKALDPHYNATQETLLQLAVISRIAGLHREEACFNLCEKQYGMTPDLAFAKASWLAATHHPDQGLQFLARTRQQHATGKDAEKTLDWDIAWANYLDLVNDSRAPKEWTTLADEHPKEVKLQWLALRAPSVQSDRPFILRTIERLRALRGDSGTLLSIIRARYILQGNPSDKDLAEAVLLLTNINRADPKVPMAHILLASAYERQGNVPGAIEELATASDLRPDAAQVGLHLAKLLQDRGDFQRARIYVDRVAGSKNATPDDRRAAAALYVRQGDVTNALQQLVAIPGADRTDADKLKLASLYISEKQTSEAEPLLRELLARPSLQVIQVAADFYASQNRMDEAGRVLSLLDRVPAPQEKKNLVRASFLARHESPKDAIQQYVEITRTSPKDTIAWRQLLLLCLSDGHRETLAGYATQASASAPGDTNLKSFSDNLAEFKDLVADPLVRPLFAALLEAPAKDLPNVSQALQLVAAYKGNRATLDQTLPKVRNLANRSPDILALQLLAAQYCLSAGQRDAAISIGMSAMRRFPASPEAAEIATACLASASRWDEVISVGSQWRNRIGGDPVEADVAIANAYLRLNRPDQCRQQLQPYLQHALKTPTYNRGVLVEYAESLIAQGRTGEAANLLSPMLAYPEWRSTWLAIASHLPEGDAVNWMTRVEKAIPAHSPKEKLLLALAYHTLAQATKKPGYTQKAIAILEPLANGSESDAETCVVLGTFYEADGNLPLAEKAYRDALAKDPDQTVALNNLAMVLTHEGIHTSEALELVSRALQLSPKVPNFYDTQASVLANEKEFSKALTAIDQAIRIDPKDPEWRANRIWLLALSGQHAGALNEYRQYQLAQSLSQLPEPVRQRLVSVGIQ